MKAAIASIQSSAVRIWKLQNRSLRVLRITFFSLAIPMGLLQALEYRNAMNVDGISYLDMGDAYLRGGWKMLVNGHWSPMYPWLLGVATVLVKPSSYWEFTMLHLVNFVAYVFALFSFDLMLRQVIASQATYRDVEHSPAPLPDWAFMAISYTIFVFASLSLIDMKQESPDMLMSVFVYLATALILYIRRSPRSWLAFFFLGTALGLGYLAKAPMFPLSFVYLGVAVILGGGLRKTVPRFLLAMTVFLAISSPLVVALSRAKGHFTFGESGKLNQLWNINGAQPAWYWQDSSRVSGTSFDVGHGRGKFLHPPRLIFRDPPVYEFTSRAEGTQPAWYDPSYWMEGAAPRFELKKQWSVFVNNLAVYFDMLFTEQGALIAVFLTLCFLSEKRPHLDGLIAQWPMLLPALAALAMYALVLVHPRYVAAFVAVTWTGLFAGLRLPRGLESRKIIIAATLALLIALGAPLTRAAVHSLTNGIRHRPHPQWEVAQALRQMGVAPGDKVARVGGTFGADWARLLRARVVAEVPRTSAPEFWTAAPLVQEQVLEVLRQTGAQIVVAQQIPPLEEFAPTPGWTRIGTSDFYLFQFQRDSGTDLHAHPARAATQAKSEPPMSGGKSQDSCCSTSRIPEILGTGVPSQGRSFWTGRTKVLAWLLLVALGALAGTVLGRFFFARALHSHGRSWSALRLLPAKHTSDELSEQSWFCPTCGSREAVPFGEGDETHLLCRCCQRTSPPKHTATVLPIMPRADIKGSSQSTEAARQQTPRRRK